MENAVVAERPTRDALDALRARVEAEYDRRLESADAETAHELVQRLHECKRLTKVATNPDESAETRLEAAMRGLDLMGFTLRSARPFEHEPSELSLPELRNVLTRIDVELATTSEAV